MPGPQQPARTVGPEAAALEPVKPDVESADGDGGGPEFSGGLTQVLEAIGGLYARLAAFTAARQPDPITADALAAVIGQAASIIDDLSTELAAIQNALETKAHTASRYGVKIGTDRRPPPLPAGPPADASAASEQYWSLAYRQAFKQAMAKARQAEQHASSQLRDLYATIEPPRELLAGVIAGTAAGG